MKTNQELIRHFVYRNKVRKKHIYINSWTCSAGFFFILFFSLVALLCVLSFAVRWHNKFIFHRPIDSQKGALIIYYVFKQKKKQKSIGLLHRFYLFNHSCGRSDDDDDATAGTKYRSSVEHNKQNKTKKVTKVRIFSSSANLLEGKKKSNLF